MLKSSGEQKSPQGATKGAETPKEEKMTLAQKIEKYINSLFSEAARERFERDRARRRAKAAQAKALRIKAYRAARAAKVKAEALAGEMETFWVEVTQAAKAASRRVVRHRRNAELRVAKGEAREATKAARREAAQLKAAVRAAEAQLRANDRALAVVLLPAPGWQPRCVSTMSRIAGRPSQIRGMAEAVYEGVNMVLKAEAARAEAEAFVAEIRAEIAQSLKAALRARRQLGRVNRRRAADKASAAKSGVRKPAPRRLRLASDRWLRADGVTRKAHRQWVETRKAERDYRMALRASRSGRKASEWTYHMGARMGKYWGFTDALDRAFAQAKERGVKSFGTGRPSSGWGLLNQMYNNTVAA